MTGQAKKHDYALNSKLAILAKQVVEQNIKAGRRIALAESCTGGLVSAAITEIPGSSAVLEASFVTYANEAKKRILNVPEEFIDTFGAVSVAVAWSMAKGALANSDADIAIAISGIAGPDGGSEQKPVGLVVFACVLRDEDGTVPVAEEIKFGQDKSRSEIRILAAEEALKLLLIN
ncbi:competence protein [Sphingorhabdus lutea]|uniref:Competence protein n=1 Tax=Sphingorhabdus lutea TaxID=1913578 RepID=A0A1L3JCC6_9SPHN|nr:CinA family protein [Sphingorhabdus lutea]APG62713.1 competence protein [Sphingorhabdus lutea]